MLLERAFHSLNRYPALKNDSRLRTDGQWYASTRGRTEKNVELQERDTLIAYKR